MEKKENVPVREEAAPLNPARYFEAMPKIDLSQSD
jgi:hypothetical protein